MMLELVWGGISSFIAICSFLVSLFAWRTSASSKHLDEKIELAISRFNDALDAKLALSFSSSKEVVLRFEMAQKELDSLDHRVKRNAEHISMLMAAALGGDRKPQPFLQHLPHSDRP